MKNPSAPSSAPETDAFRVTPPSSSLPKGGGAIRGIGEKFSANPVTGTGSITVPIAISPGRSGFGPQLSINYDSGAGNGSFGFGWRLSLPAITRKTEKGLPTYADARDSDVFILAGAEDLVPLLVKTPNGWRRETQTGGIGAVEYRIFAYRPRIEGLFARIERWTSVDGRDTFWRTISRDNVTTLYGKTSDSRVVDPADATRIFSWLICETYDDKGNAAEYTYQREDLANVDPTRLHERNRRDPPPTANTYLKRIVYGNTPSRLHPDHQNLAARAWLFEVVFDYGEGHYDEQPPDQDGRVFVTASPAPPQNARWPVRPDAFSSYRSGFEVRTYRLCRRVLMFHRFAELGADPVLVKSTDFNYASGPAGSFLQSIAHSAYATMDGQLLKASLPPVGFEYSPSPSAQDLEARQIETLALADLDQLPAGIGGADYQWTDLDGEGISGVLSEQPGAWLYKRNLGNGRFGSAEVVASRPTIADRGTHQLMDLAGDGHLDVVVSDGELAGISERTADAQWHTFRPFRSAPNVPWRDPQMHLVDLTGDGHADLIVSEHDDFVWYPSLGEDGFGPSQRVAKALDEEKGPRVVFTDGTATVFLADMSGDGLTDLVRIRSGDVCYWPNLGYGRFGAKVAMDDAPRFDHPDRFDPSRIRLSDIDGSGVTDIVYLHADGPTLYFNQSGNRWSAGRRLTQFPRIDDLSTVQVIDLLGNGTACLVWSTPLPADSTRPVRYLDLMGGAKPHLLIKIDNNLGLTTSLEYASSTRFYLQDRADGRPWITRLPFPVHVVTRTTVEDQWRGTRFASSCSYHHGYFDGEEREFRGFGRVEQQDTEEFGELSQPAIKTITWFHTGAAIDRRLVLSQFETEYFSARHTTPGFVEKVLQEPVIDPALGSREWREALRACKGTILRQEVYELDVAALQAPDPIEIPVRLFSAVVRACEIRLLQPKDVNLHAAFLVTETEAITYHHDLDLRTAPLTPDPRIVHTLTLRHDELGQPLQSVVVAYGRRAPGDYAGQPRTDLINLVQAETHIAYSETRFTKDVVLPAPVAGVQAPIDQYRLRMACEVLTYELSGIAPSTGPYFDLADFRDLDLSELYGHQLPVVIPLRPVERKEYHEYADGTVAQQRIVEHLRTLYFNDASNVTAPSVPLAFGQHGPRGLKYEDYKLALTNDLLNAVFQTRDPQTGVVVDDKLAWDIGNGVTVRDLLNEPLTPGQPTLKSGYIPGSSVAPGLANQYWIRSGIAGFAADAARHFYLPKRYVDPFGNVTTVQFDARDLFIHSNRDPLGNVTGVSVDPATGQARFDYRVLAPVEVVDTNGNRTEVRFDARGLVVATAVKGKEVNGRWQGDHLQDLTDAQINPPPPDVVRFCTGTIPDRQRARDWLGSATTRFVYHFGDEHGQWTRLMPGACAIAREQHAGQLAAGTDSPLQLSLECSDGAGNVLMKKLQAEPDPAGGVAAPMRWIVNGLTVLNNKGKPVMQYEPAFSASGFGCERPQTNGVATVMYYDAVGRLVRTDMPDGTHSRVEMTPWHLWKYDQNDTVLDSQWYADRGAVSAAAPEEKRAAVQAARHSGTPALTVLDSLGRDVIAIAHNRVPNPDPNLTTVPLLDRPWLDERYATFSRLDAEGKPLWIRDARGHLVMQFISPPRPHDDPRDALPSDAATCYDIAGNLLYQHSMDAGDRWMLMDSAGKPMVAWDRNDRHLDDATVVDERRLSRTRYDALHRPVEQWLKVNADAAALIEAFEYVDTATFTSPAGAIDQVALAATQDRNLIGQAVRHYDSGGVVTIERADFKGVVEEVTRTLVAEVGAAIVDWNLPDRATVLEPETFRRVEAHDALGRMTVLYNWHLGTGARVAVYVPAYNARGVLTSEDLIVGTTKTLTGHDLNAGNRTTAIQEIRYNAKGQRTSLTHGNGTTSRYTYDAKTFRLTRLESADTRVLQDLRYTYDAAGNITRIQDDAQPTIWFANQQVEPVNAYLYDALYRLIESTGRENVAAIGAPPHPEGPWSTATVPTMADTRRYTQRCRYDAVGNMLTVQHVASGLPGQPDGSWRRDHAYAFDDAAQPASNRLWQTWTGANRAQAVTYRHDPHGNMRNLDQTAPGQDIRWNWRDMIRALDLVGGGDVFYSYASDKQRTRKRIIRDDGSSEDRIYLGGFELYRRRDPQGVVIERIESLHVMTADERVLLVDDVLVAAATAGPDGLRVRKQTLFRYQYGNHLGSVTLELDAAAQVISYEEFHPYGTTAYRLMNSAVEAPAKRYRYTGMERDDESSLNYHGARYYAAWLGRWVGSDPAGVADGPNLYGYARGNPVGRTDSGGRQSAPDASIAPVMPTPIKLPKDRAEGQATQNAIDEALSPLGGTQSTVTFEDRDVTVVVMPLERTTPYVVQRTSSSFTADAIAKDTPGDINVTINASFFKYDTNKVLGYLGMDGPEKPLGLVVESGKIIAGTTSPVMPYFSYQPTASGTDPSDAWTIGVGDPPPTSDVAFGSGAPVVIGGLPYGPKNEYAFSYPSSVGVPETGDPGPALSPLLSQRSNERYGVLLSTGPSSGQPIIGIDRDKNLLFVMVKKHGSRAGVDLNAMRDALILMGVDDALAWDGSTSTTLVVDALVKVAPEGYKDSAIPFGIGLRVSLPAAKPAPPQILGDFPVIQRPRS